MKEFKLFVPGIARTSGSHKTFKGRIVHNNPKVKEWMQKISWYALKEFGERQILHTGAVQIEATFYLVRPQSHYGKGKNKDKLKPSAPKDHLTTPDGDKLRRAVQDALSTVIYKDDKQIVHGQEWKYYADNRQPGVMIKVILEEIE